MAQKARARNAGRIDTSSLATDRASLERNFDPGSPEHREPTSKAICYNRACPDYRVTRDADQPCGCKRTRVVIRK